MQPGVSTSGFSLFGGKAYLLNLGRAKLLRPRPKQKGEQIAPLFYL